MAAHSNRSPSPLSSRPTNPNPRFSECNPSIRRSFSGNNKPSIFANPRRFEPNTPANSPSDFARRRSVSIEGEEKENGEKDSVLKVSKLQSPAKGCKNFMAPTISAASKFSPSPRKKVLVERNDPVRTSISLSDGKAMFFSELDSNLADSEKKAVHDTKPLKKVTFSAVPSYFQHSVESGTTDSDVLEVELNSIAPPDADPSLPPYDPETNYLSPRPQFIRYKPNPRVGMLLNKEKWVDPDHSLVEEIMAQSSESDEGSDESCKEEMEVVSAAAESADMVIGMDEEIESQPHFTESLPVGTAPTEEEVVQNIEKKPRRSMFRLVGLSMIVMLLIAATSVSISSSSDELFIKDLRLSDLYQQSRAAVAASERLNLVARHVNHVSASVVSLVLKLGNELGKGERQIPLQFTSLSDLQENPWNNKITSTLEPVENLEEEDDALEETEMECVEEDKYAEEELLLDADSPDTVEEEESFDECAEVEISPGCVKHDLEYFHSESDLSSDDQQAAAAAASEHKEPELEAALDQLQTEEVSEAALEQLQTEEEVSEAAATISSDQISTTPEEKSFVAAAIPPLFAGLLAAAAAFFFIFQHKRNHHHPTSSKEVVESVLRKQTDRKNIHQDEFSQNWQTEHNESYYYPGKIANFRNLEREFAGGTTHGLGDTWRKFGV